MHDQPFAEHLPVTRRPPMRGNPPGVAKSRPRRALARARLRDFRLTVGIQRVIEGSRQQQLFVVVGHRQLESTDERVKTAGFLARVRLGGTSASRMMRPISTNAASSQRL